MTNRSDAAKRGGQTQRARGEKLRREMTARALGDYWPMAYISPGTRNALDLIVKIRELLDDLERSLQ